MPDLEKRLADLEEENRLLQKQNLEIIEKLQNFQPTLINLIQDLFQKEAMSKVELALKTSQQSKAFSQELVELMAEALENWKLGPKQQHMKELADLVEEHGME